MLNMRHDGPRRCLFSALFLLAGVIAGGDTGDIIHRDVVVVGGGASGTYAAVRLREDFGKSVLLVEKKSHLVSRPS